jgi:hypothetical protein
MISDTSQKVRSWDPSKKEKVAKYTKQSKERSFFRKTIRHGKDPKTGKPMSKDSFLPRPKKDDEERNY